MWKLSLLPFLLQAMAILCDEWIFHLKRGLPKWERVGHPLDTLTVLICMSYVLIVPFSTSSLFLYVFLAAFSSLFVTKDEFVHKEHCPASEQWLHAVLFTLHPITLIATGCMWPIVQGAAVPSWLSDWLTAPQELRLFLQMQLSAMGLFFLYQILYWNVIWKEK